MWLSVLWCPAGVGQLLSKSSLSCQVVLPRFFSQIGPLLGLLCFWSAPVGTSKLPLLQTPVWDSEAERNPGRTPLYGSLGLEVPSPSAFYSPSFRVFLGLSYIQCPGFYLYLVGGIGNIYIYPILKQKFPVTIFERALG